MFSRTRAARGRLLPRARRRRSTDPPSGAHARAARARPGAAHGGDPGRRARPRTAEIGRLVDAAPSPARTSPRRSLPPPPRAGLRAEAGEAPGRARRRPRRRVGARRVGDHDVEGPASVPAAPAARRPARRGPQGRAGRSGTARPSARRAAAAAGSASAPRPRPGSAAAGRAAARTRRPSSPAAARGPRRAAAPAPAGRPPRRIAPGRTRPCVAAEADADTSRPRLRRSSVTVSRASWCGRRRASGVTSGPSTRSVAHRDRGQRDPRVGDRAHRRAVGDVVPDEEAVPAARLGARGQLGDEPAARRAPRRGDIHAPADVQAALAASSPSTPAAARAASSSSCDSSPASAITAPSIAPTSARATVRAGGPGGIDPSLRPALIRRVQR